MHEVPGVRILAADAVQIRARPLRTPQERVVVDEFAWLRVVAVPDGLGAQRTHHLRVAPDTPFTDIQVAAFDLERRIRLDRRDAGNVRPDERRGHELDDAADGDRDEGQDRELHRPRLERSVPRLAMCPRGLLHRRRLRFLLRDEHALARRPIEVVDGDHAAAQEERPADRAQRIHRRQPDDRLEEVRIPQRAVRREVLPHEALRDPGDVHRDGVEENPERGQPEVDVREAVRIDPGAVDARDDVVEHREGQAAVPGECPHVHVGDDVVRVVGDRVHVLERHHRPLERGHPVGRHAHDHELEDRVLAHAIPGAAERQQAVHHAAPRRRDEHDREHRAERLRPVRQRGVEQVVRAGPDVEEDERPEVDDRQPVREHRAIGDLGDEVIHHAQKWRRQEERDRVVAVPPLHQRVLHPGVHRVALEQADRQFERVDDVQQRDGDEGGEVEPDRHIQVTLAATQDRADHVPAEHDPHAGDEQVDRPLELGVFLARRDAERQRQRRQDDDELPAPEVNRAQRDR